MKNKYIWIIIQLLSIVLSVFAFSPVVISPLVIKPEILGLPVSLGLGILVSLGFILLVICGVLFAPDSDIEEEI